MEKTVKNLMFDYACGRELFDAEANRVISNAEANAMIRKICMESLGLNEHSTQRDVNRALKKDSALELFEIIEDIVDERMHTGWSENEFFNEYVDARNLADGDSQEFYAEEEIVLNVAKVSGDHHDLIMQKLDPGATYTVPTSVFAVKVGTDLRLFLTGRRDWNDFIDAVVRAMMKKAQDEIYSAFIGATAKIPAAAQFNKTGTLSASTKESFDLLIEDVETANECPAVIMGTKTALKKLNALTNVDWVSPTQKENMANTGIMGTYDGTIMMEIPQRFKDNDVANKLVDSTKLMILPMVSNKFVKFVDSGETELEVAEAGATMNDQQSYEIQRRMGVAAVVTKYFGCWTLA